MTPTKPILNNQSSMVNKISFIIYHSSFIIPHSSFLFRLAQLIVLLLFLGLTVTMSLIAPFNEGPDEVAHFQFTRFIANHHRLPITLEEKAEAGYKSDWPPLFHLLVGFAGQGIDLASPPFVKIAQNNPRLQLVVGHENIISWRALTTEDPYQGEILLWYLGRWLTVISGLAGIVATYGLVRAICPASPWLALSAAALLAFLPTYPRVSGVISYEPLLGVFLTLYFLLLYHTLQNPGQNWLYLALGLAIGLAGLVKHTPLPAVPVLFLLLIWLGYRQQWAWRVTIWRLTLVSFGLLITAGSWVIYVIIYFNRIDQSGWIHGLIYPFLISDGSDATSLRIASLVTGGGSAALATRPYDDDFLPWAWRLLNWAEGPLTWPLLALWALAIAGFIRRWSLFTDRQKLWPILLLGHIALLLLLPFLRFFLTGQAATAMLQHIIFPVGPAVILLTVQGAAAWLKPNLMAAILLVLAAALSLTRTIPSVIGSYTSPWPIQTTPLSQDEHTLAAFAGISLIDYRSEANDRTLSVTLQWRTEQQLNEDYQVELTLLDPANQPRTRWLGQPLNGRYPTRAWTPGDRVRDLIYLPIAGLPPGDYSLQLRVLAESGFVAPQPGSSQIIVENNGVKLKLAPLSPVSILTPTQTVSLADQTIAYIFWHKGQPVVDALPLYHENETALFTIAPQTPPHAETEMLRLQLLGPDQQAYEPVDQTGLTYNFMMKPHFAPGNYRLRFEQWSGQQLVAQAETPPLLHLETQSRQFTLAQPISHPLSANFAGYVALLGYDLSQRRVQPGGQLPLTLHWQALRAIGADLIFFNHLLAADQKIWGGRDRLAREVYSTMLWAPQEIVSDPFMIQVDPDAPPGIYHISVGLYLPVGQAAISLPLQQEGQLTNRTSLELGPIKVGKTLPGLTIPTAEPQIRLNQSLGPTSELTLLGYDLTDKDNHPIHNLKSKISKIPEWGQNVKLVLYWQVEQPLAVDYTTFVHVRDAANQTIAQQDQPPLAGAYPTGLWEPGEIIADEITIPITTALPEGEYKIVVGMYDPDTTQRLSIPDQANNELILKTLTLTPAPAPGPLTFTGTWDGAEHGILIMTQEGNNVFGTYQYLDNLGRTHYGYIKGTVEGNTLKHNWWQSSTSAPSYEQAEERGDGYFILGKDGATVQGQWRSQDDSDWAGEWNLVRK